ncbi:hypothetical protein P7C70_g801, partial [Phenoliferia sp. Uapishka_3]
MISILSLPPELLIQIISQSVHTPCASPTTTRTRLNTLLSLTQVSHLFRDLAEPLLYSCLSIKTEERAQQLLTSEAFLRHGVVELELHGILWGGGAGVWNETAIELLRGAGQRGLKSLKTRFFVPFEITELAYAGAGCSAHLLVAPNSSVCDANLRMTCTDLQYLELFNHLSRVEPPEGWQLPFQLVHIGLNGADTPQTFISLVASSPSISSLDLNLQNSSSSHDALFALPQFPSFAAQITKLRLAIKVFPKSVPHPLSNFTSIQQLELAPQIRRFDQVVTVLESLPPSVPTITHLTLGLKPQEFISLPNQKRWAKVMNSKVLERLEVITWSEMDGNFSGKLLNVLWGGRTVLLKWRATMEEYRSLV